MTILILLNFLAGQVNAVPDSLSAGQMKEKEINKLYEEGKYFDVIERAEMSLKDSGISIEDKIGIRTVLAFSYVALDKKRLAKLEFLEILSIKPEMELDPILTSPKIIKVFREAKSASRFAEKDTDFETRYDGNKLAVPKKDFLAFAVPGMWEIKKENKKTGCGLMGMTAISALTLGVSQYRCEKYHREYLDARELNDINAQYDNYNLWYKIRTSSITALALTYTINLILLAL